MKGFDMIDTSKDMKMLCNPQFYEDNQLSYRADRIQDLDCRLIRTGLPFNKWCKVKVIFNKHIVYNKYGRIWLSTFVGMKSKSKQVKPISKKRG